MNKNLKIFTTIHKSTQRNYLQRMMDNKVYFMNLAKKYSKDYWDGDRRAGYGGYKFIENYWAPVAKKLIKKYNLNNRSKILDVGCGKGFLLYEIKKILPKITVRGFDISKYAIVNSHEKVKKFIKVGDARKNFKYKTRDFDLAISLGCIHNLEIFEIKNFLKEISRVSRSQYVMTESYRDEKELFNLQCWALTCETFLSIREWKWVFKEFKYKGDYEFIFFE